MKRIVLLIVLGLFVLALLGGISYGNGLLTSTNPQYTNNTTGQNQTTIADDEKFSKANEAIEASEVNEPTESATEAEDENLPNGGHTDPDGIDVDHQFEGVE